MDYTLWEFVPYVDNPLAVKVCPDIQPASELCEHNTCINNFVQIYASVTRGTKLENRLGLPWGGGRYMLRFDYIDLHTVL